MNSPVHRVKWRLVYGSDDDYIDEAVDDASIRLARPGASHLLIMEMLADGGRVPHWRIPLTEVHEGSAIFGPGGQLLTGDTIQLRPIFYRRRGVDAFNGARGDVRTFGLVFGAGREDEMQGTAKLFFWRPGLREPVSCPAEYIDKQMVALQLFEPEPGPIEVA